MRRLLRFVDVSASQTDLFQESDGVVASLRHRADGVFKAFLGVDNV